MNPEDRSMETPRWAEVVVRQLRYVARAPMYAMRTLAEHRATQADRYVAIADRLSMTLASGDPQVVGLRQRAANAREAATLIQNQFQRVELRPQVTVDAGYVFGRVLDPGGKVVPQLRIRLVPRVNSEHGEPSPATSDEFGDFCLKVVERECCDTGGQALEYQVMAEDSRGNLVHSVPQTITLRPGTARFLEVVLAPPPRTGS